MLETKKVITVTLVVKTAEKIIVIGTLRRLSVSSYRTCFSYEHVTRYSDQYEKMERRWFRCNVKGHKPMKCVKVTDYRIEGAASVHHSTKCLKKEGYSCSEMQIRKCEGR